MFNNPSMQIICDPRVKHGIIKIGHNVDIILVFFHGILSSIIYRTIFSNTRTQVWLEEIASGWGDHPTLAMTMG
jgi:hypothetical protein